VVAKDDPDPTALACYGLLLRADPADGQASAELWLRFVDGRPVCPVIIGCRHESQLSVPEKVA